MIFISRKLIFLHVQKTGGNSVTKTLLPFSDDEMTLNDYQDAIDRFGIKGVSPRKHAKLPEYKEILGTDFDDFKVALTVRDPLARAVSLYFSPHKWMVVEDEGWHYQDPYWDIDRFEKLVAHMYSLEDFLTVDGEIRMPDHVMRFRDLQSNFADLCREYDFPMQDFELPVANVSAASHNLKKRALSDPRTKELVDQRFTTDYKLISEFHLKFAWGQAKAG
ncbi:MAG: sulfotransferase family 2 domain-containing protein [Sulfitobacter sp.]